MNLDILVTSAPPHDRCVRAPGNQVDPERDTMDVIVDVRDVHDRRGLLARLGIADSILAPILSNSVTLPLAGSILVLKLRNG